MRFTKAQLREKLEKFRNLCEDMYDDGIADDFEEYACIEDFMAECLDCFGEHENGEGDE